MAGLAQKGGAVFSHVRICNDPSALHAVRITTGGADAVIGGDAIVSAAPEALAKMQPGRTRAIINSAATPTAEFTPNPDWQFPQAHIEATLAAAIGTAQLDYLDATTLARHLMGHTVYANLLLLGFAWQRGLLPVSEAALTRAIELNGTAVEMNLRAFRWGRQLAHDPASVPTSSPAAEALPARTLTELVADRAERLTAYQNAALAARYRALLDPLMSATAKVGAGATALAETVARNYFKLLAIKDEYEVARLYAETDFLALVAAQFAGDYRLRFHLAPPLLARPDPTTGHIAKRSFGPWMMTAFKWLARARRWRGTRWDLFGRSAERRQERQLIADYEDDIRLILERLDANTLPAASALAAWPEEIRGFGPVKTRNIDVARPRRERLRASLGP
jgi:indolepyruvate ferredoxin oxidoreductase